MTVLLPTFADHRTPGALSPPWLERCQRAALLLTAFLGPAGYAAIGLVCLLLTVSAEGIIKRRIPWRRSALDVFIVAFVAVFMISGWASQYRPLAVGSAGLAAVTIYLAFGPLYQQIQREGMFLTTFLGTWAAGGALAAVWALYLHLRTQRPAFTPELTQNMLATTMLIAFVVSMGVFFTTRSLWRYLAAVASIVSALTLTETISRGGWLSAAAAVACFLILAGRRHFWAVAGFILLTGLAVLIITTPERSRLLPRASTIPQVGQLDRVLLARSAIAIFADHPVVGTGLNTFSLVHAKYKLPGDTNIAPPYAHNVYLNMAAEGGALGLVAFLSILFWTAGIGWRWHAASTSQRDRILSITILSAFVGLLVHQVFDGTILSVHVGAALWSLIAIVAASLPFSQSPHPSVDPQARSAPREVVR